MDLLSTYHDDEAQESSGPSLAPRLLSVSSSAAPRPVIRHAGPHVALALIPSDGAASAQASAGLSVALRTGMMMENIPASMMYAPIVGPVNPAGGKAPVSASGDTFRTPTASLTSDSMDPATFSAQYNMYSTHRFAADPSGSGALVGDSARYAAISGQASLQTSAERYVASVPGQKRARDHNDDSADAQGYLGPWAGFNGEKDLKVSAMDTGSLTLHQKQIRLDQGLNPDAPGKLDADALQQARAKIKAEVEKEKKEAEKAAATDGQSTGPVSKAGQQAKQPRLDTASASGAGGGAGGATEPGRGILSIAECKSTFQGPEQFDYQGRSWMEAPKGMRPDEGEHECFVPKKCIHRWSGHGKGVNSVAFIPGTGHILLSASLDGKAKVWDVAGSKGVRRTYSGHSGGVRQAVWASDGRKFTTVSFDRSAKVWDTETGICLGSWSNGSTPLCTAWVPGHGDNSIVTGTQNKKILQYDLRAPSTGAGAGAGSGSSSSSTVPSSEPSLEYDYHLGPVNAITFFDGGRRFMSAGDDRLLIWDTGTPVPIKHIADPSQHAVTAAALHPDGSSWVGQSMDNSLVVYTLGDRIGRNLKKTFKGHIVAGYACQPCFSSDGRFLGSGDGSGSAWFWDWRSHRVLNKFHAHDNGPCAGMDWHPLQPSWVATCGWDGVIKLWD